jgi:hypothetical protein
VKKGADLGPGPAVHMDDEGGLNSIALGDEDEIISCPQYQKDTIEITIGEIVLQPVFVLDNSLAD